MLSITAGIVLFKNDFDQIKRVILSLLSSSIKVEVFLLDNSPDDRLKKYCESFDLTYIFNGKNVGFGAGHNKIFNDYCSHSDFHIYVNPDIEFDQNVIDSLCNFANLNSEIGLLMPNILYPDNSAQPLARLLPSPIDLIFRRFNFLNYFFPKVLVKYELKTFSYDYIIDVPFVSGCFMFCNSSVIKKIKGFDENFFLFMEDVDFSRRVIESGYRSVIYPFVVVYHDHKVKSFIDFKNFVVYLKSAFYYFYKWGYFFDPKRKEFNVKTLNQIKKFNKQLK